MVAVSHPDFNLPLSQRRVAYISKSFSANNGFILYSQGNIQFDDPLLPYFCAESVLSGMKARGVDPESVLETYFQTYKNILKDRPQDMNIGMHLCRGNFRVSRLLRPHHLSIPAMVTRTCRVELT